MSKKLTVPVVVVGLAVGLTVAMSSTGEHESRTPAAATVSEGGVNPEEITLSGEPSPSLTDVLADDSMAEVRAARAVADDIRIFARDQSLDGLVDTEITPDSVVLYWYGKVPSDVKAMARRAEVKVTIKAAAFSLSQLDEFAESVSSGRMIGGEILGLRPSDDYTGIEVSIQGSIASSAALPEETPEGIPLIYSEESHDSNLAYERWDDSAPFWGGAAIDHLENPITRQYRYCTTAFGARSTINGRDGMLSAAHCGTGVDWKTPRGDVLVGASGPSNVMRDAMLMHNGQAYGSGVYLGPPDSSSGAQVTRVANPSLGDWVAPSGSWSGAAVVEVIATNEYVNIGGTMYGPGFHTQHPNGIASVGPGDSGGPVVNFDSASQFTARGLINSVRYSDSSGNYEGPCIGYTTSQRACSSRAFHINITAIEDTMSLRVKTS
jgi:hypothetical protein